MSFDNSVFRRIQKQHLSGCCFIVDQRYNDRLFSVLFFMNVGMKLHYKLYSLVNQPVILKPEQTVKSLFR